jgi:hypothetical protein
MKHIKVSSRFEGDDRFGVMLDVFPPDSDGRVCMVVSTGCSMVHIRMTRAEVSALVDALCRTVDLLAEAADEDNALVLRVGSAS